jgi:hypothetical protein
VEEFADACHRDKEGVAEGVALKSIASEDVICHKDRKGEQRREEVIASPVKVKLRRL